MANYILVLLKRFWPMPEMAEPFAKVNFDVSYLITPFLLTYRLWVLLDLANTRF